MFWILAHAGGGESWLPLQMTPIHPILVNFTAALVPTSLAADVLGRFLHKPSLTATAWWTLLAAALVTPLTAAAGLYWKQSMDMPGEAQLMAIHQWLGISLTVLFLGLAIWRGQLFRRERVPGYGYLGALFVLVGLLTLQGHLGGVMSFAEGDTSSPDHSVTTSVDSTTMPSTPGIRMSGESRSTSARPSTTPTMVAPSSATSIPTTDADGWSDSIHVKGK